MFTIFQINTDGLLPYSFEKKKLENKDHLKEFIESNQTMSHIDPKNEGMGQDTDNVINDIINRCLKKNSEVYIY